MYLPKNTLNLELLLLLIALPLSTSGYGVVGGYCAIAATFSELVCPLAPVCLSSSNPNELFAENDGAINNNSDAKVGPESSEHSRWTSKDAKPHRPEKSLTTNLLKTSESTNSDSPNAISGLAVDSNSERKFLDADEQRTTAYFWILCGVVLVGIVSFAARFLGFGTFRPSLVDASSEANSVQEIWPNHQMNNLLAAIVSSAELGRTVDDSAIKNQLFEKIVDSGLAASKLTSEESDVPQVRIKSTVSRSSRLKNIRLLFVEDDAVVRDMYGALLSSHDADLTLESSTEAAIERIERGEEFDCVITDFNLPDLCGAELAKCLRITNPGVPVILVSANSKDEVFEPELFDFFLAKPFTTAELLACLEHVNRESGVSSIRSELD